VRTRILKGVFGAAGVAFLVVAFLQSWDRSQGLPVVAWPRLALAAAMVFASLHAGLRGWAALLGVPARFLAAGFFTSQLGKYVPGAVWQAVGQVGYATNDAVTVHRATVGFVAFAVTQATSGAVVGSFLMVAPGGIPGWVRLSSAAGFLALPVLHRGWLVRVVAWVARLRGATVEADDLVPGQRAIGRAAGWGAVSLVAMAIGFAAALPTAVTTSGWVTVVLGFVLAWTVGFLAVPVPAGVGVREAVLLASLGHLAGTSTIVAASVTLRLIAMGAEATAIGFSRLRGAAVGGGRSRYDGTRTPD
jgi:glycosyltransferase 2 family protein